MATMSRIIEVIIPFNLEWVCYLIWDMSTTTFLQMHLLTLIQLIKFIEK